MSKKLEFDCTAVKIKVDEFDIKVILSLRGHDIDMDDLKELFVRICEEEYISATLVMEDK